MLETLQFKEGEIINLQIVCNAKEQDLQYAGGLCKVRLRAQPIKGKANKELVEYFKSLGYKIEIIKGEKSNIKLIKILKIIK